MTMKSGKYLILGVVAGAIASAQNRTDPLGYVTIKPIVHEVRYCVGPTSYFVSERQPGASDIILRLSLKLLYENHRSDPIVLPLRFRSRVRMAVMGQGDAETVTSREDPMDPKAVLVLARPEPPYFIVIPSGKSDLAYLGEFVDVPVRAAGKQLLGTTVQFSITRNHGLLPPSVVEQLQTRWTSYGTLWTGISDSETINLSIPESPEPVDCRKDERF